MNKRLRTSVFAVCTCLIAGLVIAAVNLTRPALRIERENEVLPASWTGFIASKLPPISESAEARALIREAKREGDAGNGRISITLLERALKLKGNDKVTELTIWWWLSEEALNQHDRALRARALQEVLRLQSEILGPIDPDTIVTLTNLYEVATGTERESYKALVNNRLKMLQEAGLGVDPRSAALHGILGFLSYCEAQEFPINSVEHVHRMRNLRKEASISYSMLENIQSPHSLAYREITVRAIQRCIGLWMFTGQDDRAYAAWKHAMEVYEPILTVGGRQFLAGRAVISEYFAICLRERLMLDKDASNARGRCLKAIEALRSAIADRDSAGRRNNAWALRRDLAECYLRLGDKNAAGVCCAELKQIEESLQSGGPLVSEIHKELLKLAAKIKSAH